METSPLITDAIRKSLFILVFVWVSFSANAQCPTISDPTPPPICDASGFTFGDMDAFATDNGNGIAWYTALTGGSPFNPNQLVVEGTYYADDLSESCGVRPSIIIDFQVDASGQNLDGIYCSNENATIQTYIDDVLQPNIPAGGSVEIYTDFDLTNLSNSTDPIPNGATNYYIVFVDGGGCKSQIEGGNTAVFDAPADPTPSDPQEFCSDTNPTVGDLDPGTTSFFSWYDGLDGFGDPILPALSLTTPLVDGNTYYVQIDDIFCKSNPVAVNVIIDVPVDPGTNASLEYCEDNVPLTDFNLFDELGGSPDITGTWSGPLATSNGNLGTVNISTLTAPGIYVFTYTVPSTGICPDQMATVTITIFDTFTSGIPSGANPATYCVADLPTAFDLFTLLDNEDPNGQWTLGTTSSDPIVSSPIDLSGFTVGVHNFTYTHNLLPNPCPEESTTVQVIVLQDPNAGIAINASFCENDLIINSPFDLFNALDGSQDNNLGSWTDASSNPIVNPIDINGFTVAGSPYTFNYTIDNGSCIDTEPITITVLPSPESGVALAPIEICEENVAANSPFDLFTLLDGTQDTNGTWYDGIDTSGPVVANPVDISALTAGTYNYTYSVPMIGTCSDVDVTVQIIILPRPNTGIPTPISFCENDLVANSPLDLFGQLSGNDLGGAWSDDDASGALIGSDVDLTGLSIGAYNYTYSITGANGCSNSSTVTITIEDAPESGVALAPIEICEENVAANSPFDLFTLLDGTQDTNGTWYDGIDTSGSVVTNPLDISALTAGTFNYTYSVPMIGTCSDVDVTVQIIVLAMPTTGIPTPISFCENDLVANSPLDLFGQLSGNDLGGTWSDDDASGALIGSDVDLTGLSIGVYNYTYSITGANGCSNSSTVTITIEDAPESGTVNAPAEFCLADITAAQTFDLFDLLDGEDQTGVWSDDTPSGALVGNLVTIDGLAVGTYDFTFNVDAIGSCDDSLVTVSVIISDTPIPTASAIQEFCDSAIVADLSAGGTAIQWYDEATGGSPLASDVQLIDGETYYATQTDATTGCESSIRVEVTVTIFQSPNSGNPSTTPIFACNDNNSIDLNTGLDGTQDSGGTWQDTDGTGGLSGNIFDAIGIPSGTYQFTYLVTASAPCTDASTIITVTIDEPMNPGTDAALDVCSDGGTTDLFSLIGPADTGGIWTPALASGTGICDPLVDASGTYTYTLTNACGNYSSEVVVTITQAPNAGTDNAISICVIDGAIDLFTQLGGTPDDTGVWSPALASGTGEFDPLVDTAGVYTYSVASVAPCTTDASAEVTIVVNDSAAPVAIDSNPSYCLVDNPTVADLDANLSASGVIIWYADSDLTTELVGTEELVDAEDYFATQTNSSGCESSVSVQINVIVNDAATPTLINLNQELCINDEPTINELTLNVTEYDSMLSNVIWYDSDIDGSVISNNELLVNATTYYAVLVDPVTGCESSIRLAVTTDLTGCGVLVIPDGFSPNGDGVNDTFDIDNLGILYPNFEMEIYNRFGNSVYKGNASTPRFNGKSNQSRTLGSGDLPVGVYYYIFNFNDGVNKPEQGSLYLSR